jgi:UDP-glucose 4-epimerase
MAKTEDLVDYYRIPADTRDLNYADYFSEGDTKVSSLEDYNSHNARRLSMDETIELLRRLDIVQTALKERRGHRILEVVPRIAAPGKLSKASQTH